MLESVDAQVGTVVDALREHEHRRAHPGRRHLRQRRSGPGGQPAPARRQGRALRGRHPGPDDRHLGRRTGAGGPHRRHRRQHGRPAADGARPRRRAAGPRPAPLRRHQPRAAARRPARPGAAPTRDAMFWVYPHHIGSTHPHAAVRVGDLKLVQHLRDGAVELYDLARDEAETTDLATVRAGRHPPAADACSRTTCARSAVVPPAPTAEAYPVAEPRRCRGTRSTRSPCPRAAFAGDDGRRGRPAPGHRRPGCRTCCCARASHRSSDRRVARCSRPAGSTPAASSRRCSSGLAVDEGTYLLLRYRHDLKRVGWDLRVDGQVLDAGAEPLTSLDGSVDLSAPGSRLGFVLRGTQAASYVDQGRGAGWEFLYAVSTAGAFDLRDPALRARTRYAASARVQGTEITLGPLVAGRRCLRRRQPSGRRLRPSSMTVLDPVPPPVPHVVPVRLSQRHPWLFPWAVRAHQAAPLRAVAAPRHDLGAATGPTRPAGAGQAARLAADARALRGRDGAAAQQGGQPAPGLGANRRRAHPSGRDVQLQQGRRQLHRTQGLRRGHAALQRRRRPRRRRRHLPARQPAALDGAALAADRGRAQRALLRPVPRQGPGAAVGRRLLDRLQLRRPGVPQRHRHDVPAAHLGRRAPPARRAARRPGDHDVVPGRGARRAASSRRPTGRVYRSNEIWRTVIDKRTGDRSSARSWSSATGRW